MWGGILILITMKGLIHKIILIEVPCIFDLSFAILIMIIRVSKTLSAASVSFAGGNVLQIKVSRGLTCFLYFLYY